MKILRTLAGSALIAGLLVGATGCELITAPDRGKIDTSGGGNGTGGTTGGGGSTGATGGTTGGGGATGGTTGGGGTACTPVDDGKECTDDVCENDTPVNKPKSAGATCTEGGGAVCDGNGACVGCLVDGDCTAPQVCKVATTTCVDPTCDDMKIDGSETDVDCGGSCSPAAACDDLKKCMIDADCKSGVCADDGNGQLACQVATCNDTVQNGGETDADCGGSCAPAQLCADLLKCAVDADCQSGVCKDDGSGALKCAVPACGDGVQQVGEPCDDGNQTNNDGCDVTVDGKCQITGCGNGVIAGTEVCDDGNLTDGDGCDNNCTPTACGNGILTAGETCDDANAADGDGCSAACAPESGWSCNGAPSVCDTTCGDGIKAGAEACDDNNVTTNDGCNATCGVETGWGCTGAPLSSCSPICGDGLLKGAEACDDGGTANGNGCSATCTLESGYVCMGEPSMCMTVCGDGITAGAETCDDANATAGDGCTTCLVDSGFTCAGAPSLCTPVCGDGKLKGAETCDDSNTANGDGCSSACGTETGFTCAGEPSVCAAICGDGLKKGAEACDDSNTTPGDGCSATCTVETGYTCTPASPSVCTPVCGDGLLKPGEACDDGNAANNDCCSSTCQIEAGCELEPNDSCATALALPAFAGNPAITSIKGNINPAADLDFYTFTLPGPGVSAVRVETYFGAVGTCSATAANDTAIELRGTTCATVLTTNDDGSVGWCSTIDGATTAAARGLAAGTYTVRVARSSFGSQVPLVGYGLQVKIIATCGNGTTDPTETCDDSNTTAGDGCNALCQTETGFTCTGTPSVCVPNCGNGTLQAGEACDDNNQSAGDGCTACQIDAGYTCTGTPSVCTFTCGNGTITGNEACDDNNTTPGDGCSATCTVEANYVCTGTPSVCTIACGNGAINVNEQCDDGNVVNGDGCNSACAVEPFYQCNTFVSPNTCAMQETNCSDGLDGDGDGLTDAADTDCTVPPYFVACGAGEQLLVYRGLGTPKAIPDSNVTGITIPVVATLGRTITRAAILFDITHTWDSDVDMFLTAPGGTALDINTDNGSSSDNYTATLLDTTCATAVTAGAAPFTGCFKPEASFAAFNGSAVSTGQWLLKVADDAGGDTGTLNGWELLLCTTP